jgi:hypothetical protein
LCTCGALSIKNLTIPTSCKKNDTCPLLPNLGDYCIDIGETDKQRSLFIQGKYTMASKLGKLTSKRNERTTRRFGQRLHSRPMPVQIHLRAYTPEGELVGIGQRNDTFMVAIFDHNERALCPPVVFEGAQARKQAAVCASALLGRKVTL